MKNIIKITALSALALLLISAVFVTYSINTKLLTDASYGDPLPSLESMLVYSDSIVIATVEDVLPGRWSNIHQLSNVQTIWGVQTDENISAHDGRHLDEGKTYMLMLYQSDDHYILDDGIFELKSSGRLSPFTADGSAILGDIATLDDFRGFLLENIGLLRPAPKSVPTYMHIDEQLEAADIIAKIRFTDKTMKAGQFCISPYEIVEVYRGEAWPENTGRHLSKPRNEEVTGNEYIIFMKHLEDGRLVPLSSNHSTLAMGDDRARLTLEHFSK